MNTISIPPDRSLYPEIVGETVMAARMVLGDNRLTFRYNRVPGGIMPTMIVDFFSEKSKQYSLYYHLPVDTPERTDRRISLLMRLMEREIRDTASEAA